MKLTPTLCIVAACASTAAMGEPPQAGLARLPRKTCMSDFTPERPDGRSAKAYTWAMLELRDRMRSKHEELKEKFRRLDDLKSADSRKRYIAYLQDTDWTDAKLIEFEKRMCLDFLRGRTDFPVSH